MDSYGIVDGLGPAGAQLSQNLVGGRFLDELQSRRVLQSSPGWIHDALSHGADRTSAVDFR